CHDRVRRSLDLLERLHAHVQQHGVDAQARDAAADVLRYFDIAGPAHHEDEERHVLPRLRAAGLHDMADRLHAEHAEMQRLWESIREPLGAWANGRLADLNLVSILNYITLYRTHLALEDDEAFSVAQAGLSDSTIAAMGQEMAARRHG
ncbi:MAG: hemerythrin domain-containing protein, partial [Rubrivivax sp.]